MVNTLLDFTRLEPGHAHATFAPTDLAAMTRDLASAFESAAAQAGLELVVECPPLPEPVFVDPELWEQVVLNLLSNANKYTHAGWIRVALAWHAGDAVLRVEDSGVGIPEAELPHIFERFHRARVTEGRSHEGTGIGLALVQELAAVHGGAVEVESVLGEGSKFRVRIPSGSAHLPVDQLHPQPGHARASSRTAAYADEARRWSAPDAPRTSAPRDHEPPIAARIPVIDDNPDLRGYVVGLLAQGFRQVDSAADGEAGLALARATRPDVILSDVMMPRLDGFALVRALRADDRTRATPVILLSARAGDESTTDALSTGANDYLIKPFSARELIARVKTHLEMTRARREVTRHELIEADLRQAVQMRDDFLTVASHELRTPLTTLGLQADALLRAVRNAGGAAPLVHKAEVIRAQANQLESLVEGMLDVSSLEGGALRLELTEVDLGELARSVAARFAGQAGRTSTPLTTSALAVVGRWDARRVTQALTHVVLNALKFGKGKPVELRVERHGELGQITVSDHGIGIAPEHHAWIFDRFERGVSERHYGGLGLGLWIARQLIHAMGGTIRAASAVGEGAAFTIELPIA
ncbi:MAG TPA: ATP-binding protein [Kofleriaceae bacterium]